MDDTLFNISTPDGPRYIPEKALPHNRTETSMKAANAQAYNKVVQDRNAIMSKASRRGRMGIIRADCEWMLGMASGTYTARINDLVNRLDLVPLLDDAGNKVRRKNVRGKTAEVLITREHAYPHEIEAAKEALAEKAAKRRLSA